MSGQSQPPLRVAVFGDSVAAGLGVRGRSYPQLVAHRLRDQSGRSVELSEHSGIATPVAHSLELLDGLASFEPSIVIVHHGITEGLLRPKASALQFMPRRWRQPGWMDPRPFFSARLSRRLLQRIDSSLRWRLKALLIRAHGGETVATPAAFERDLEDLVSRLINAHEALIVLVTHCGADERLFAGSARTLEQCRAATERVAGRHESHVVYCDATQTCQRWDDYFDDHMHPNESGHDRIANQILHLIEQRSTPTSRS